MNEIWKQLKSKLEGYASDENFIRGGRGGPEWEAKGKHLETKIKEWKDNVNKAIRSINKYNLTDKDAKLVRFYDTRSGNDFDENKSNYNEDKHCIYGVLCFKDKDKNDAYYLTLEEPWWGNRKNVSCIPSGTYKLHKRHKNAASKKRNYNYYQLFPSYYDIRKDAAGWKIENYLINKVWLSENNDVKINYGGYGRTSILIHNGKNPGYILGCILLGTSLEQGSKYPYNIEGPEGDDDGEKLLKEFSHTNIKTLQVTDVFANDRTIPTYKGISIVAKAIEPWANSTKEKTSTTKVVDPYGNNTKEALNVYI